MRQIYTIEHLLIGLDDEPEFFRTATAPEWVAAGSTKHSVAYRLDQQADSGAAHGDGLCMVSEKDASAQSSDGLPVFDLGLSTSETLELFDLARTETGTHYRNRILDEGPDGALGWYAPCHAKGLQFGIYLRLSGVLCLARELMAHEKKGKLDPQRATQLAIDIVVLHEWAHFLVERMILQMENAYEVPIWAAQFDAGVPHRGLEEGVANAYMLRRLLSGKWRGSRAPRTAILNFVKQQPEAYRSALGIWRLQRDFAEAGAELACFLRQDVSRFGPVDWRALAGFDHSPDPDWQGVPIILVDDFLHGRHLLSPAFIRAIEHVEETERFQSSLSKLGGSAERLWKGTKRKLAETVSIPGLDFKRWDAGGKDVFSVRVDQNLRAHLRFEARGQRWIAEKIGGHRAMGHG